MNMIESVRLTYELIPKRDDEMCRDLILVSGLGGEYGLDERYDFRLRIFLKGDKSEWLNNVTASHSVSVWELENIDIPSELMLNNILSVLCRSITNQLWKFDKEKPQH